MEVTVIKQGRGEGFGGYTNRPRLRFPKASLNNYHAFSPGQRGRIWRLHPSNRAEGKDLEVTPISPGRSYVIGDVEERTFFF